MKRYIGATAAVLTAIVVAACGGDGQAETRQPDATPAAVLGASDVATVNRGDLIVGIRNSPRTLQEIGEEFGISRERARQIEKRLLDKLRKYLEEELGSAVDIGATDDGGT